MLQSLNNNIKMPKNKSIKNILIIFIILLISYKTPLYAQVVFVSINDNVYQYLDRMNLRNIIQLNSEKKPYSRVYISEKLIEIRKNLNKINRVDSNLLDWFEEEYSYELNVLLKEKSNNYTNILPKSYNYETIKDRWRIVDYVDSIFSFRLSPIVGTRLIKNGKDLNYSGWIGASAWMTGSDWFGSVLDLRNIGEFGDLVDDNKFMIPDRGFDVGTSHANGIEYSDVRAQININWDWGTISFKKDYIEWGNSYFGNLILSDKAPSFPHFSFEIKPTKWFRFYYLFGWLHSGVIDSSRTIIVRPSDESELLFERFIKKYFAANMLTITVASWFDFSFGNSFIYAGDIRPEIFIPFNFYKFMDRNTGKKSFEDGNGAFYFDLVIRFPRTFKFYSTLFFDVDSRNGSIGNFLNESIYGMTFGGRKVDLYTDNLDLTIEYTRINPVVYEHKYASLTDYKHLDYSLGHWIGQNADQLQIQIDYQMTKEWYFKFWVEFIRKGGAADIKSFYIDNELEPFLFPPLRKDFYLGLDFRYEIIHTLFIKGNYIYSNIKDEDENRTDKFMIGKNNLFSLTVSYGI